MRKLIQQLVSTITRFLVFFGIAFKAKYFIENGISGLFTNLGIQAVFANAYNAKAKPIERFFREMQDCFERLLPSFVGSCIDNKPAYLKRNEKKQELFPVKIKKNQGFNKKYTSF